MSPAELTARAALVADVRDYLCFTEAEAWRAEVRDEALIRFFGATELEACLRYEFPQYPHAHWMAIADRHGIHHDGTHRGARAALERQALVITGLTPEAWLEGAENAFALWQWQYDAELAEAIARTPGCTLTLMWAHCPVPSETVPWLAFYEVAEPRLRALSEGRAAVAARKAAVQS